MSVYDVKTKRLALLLLPTAWRKPLIAALVQSCVQGVNMLHGEFMRWRDNKQYRLWHNGQVCYLRAVLNDTFDPIARRITVDGDADSSQGACVFLRETGRQKIVPSRITGSAIVLNRRGYGGTSGLDFFVSIPYELRDKIDENHLKAIVNVYKLASKRWAINYTTNK